MKKQLGCILAALMAVVVMAIGGCSSGSSDTSSGLGAGGGTVTYSISGTITSGGAALADVTVSTNGGSATTNAGGYTIGGLANGNYTITPVKTGFTFSPATLAVTVNGANLTGQNFTATATGSGSTGTNQLPKTGQTTSYAAGDDGALQKGVAWPNPRFTDNTNGTVTDNLTGLVWLKNANCFGIQNWTTALASANTLASGACGLSDGSSAGQWRLPNINELESLVDLSRFAPALPSGHPFTSANNYYWSSSSLMGLEADVAWAVFMTVGSIGSDAKSTGNFYSVWPVRSGQVAATIALQATGQTTCYDASGTAIACAGTGQDGDKLKGVTAPAPRFTDNDNGTVTDKRTGLIWLKNANCFNEQDWTTSLTFANTLASGACGLTDGSTSGQWRLPNRKEFSSLMDRSISYPALSIGHPYLSVQNGMYWSSSSFASDINSAWLMGTQYGHAYEYPKNLSASSYGNNYVWPVRSGL
jgi:hypothetical protein